LGVEIFGVGGGFFCFVKGGGCEIFSSYPLFHFRLFHHKLKNISWLCSLFLKLKLKKELDRENYSFKIL